MRKTLPTLHLVSDPDRSTAPDWPTPLLAVAAIALSLNAVALALDIAALKIVGGVCMFVVASVMVSQLPGWGGRPTLHPMRRAQQAGDTREASDER